MANELILPRELREELIEEEVQKRLLHGHTGFQIGADFPVSYRTNRHGISLGQAPTAAKLLKEQQGWAQIANRAIMMRISGLDWMAGRRVFDDEIGKWKVEAEPEHMINEILDMPNPYFSGITLKWIMAGLLMQTGCVYLQKLRDPAGVTRELWPIPTQFVEPIALDHKVVGGYQITTTDGIQVILELEDIIRVWTPDLETLFGQLGALEGQSIEYDARKAMHQHLGAFFEKDAIPRAALIADKEIIPNTIPKPNSPEWLRLKAQWRMAHDRRHGTDIGMPAFLPPGFGIYEFTPADVSSNVPLDERWSKQVMAAYGTPMFAVGIDTNTNRATGETTMWAWDKNLIEPVTRFMGDGMTIGLAKEFAPDLVVVFEDFVTPDKDHELRRDEVYLDKGKVVINELRRRDKQAEVSWGDMPRGTSIEQPYTGEIQPVVDLTPNGPEDPDDIGGNEEQENKPPVDDERSRAELTSFSAESVSEFNLSIERKYLKLWQRAQMNIWAAQLEVALSLLARAGGVKINDIRSMVSDRKRISQFGNQRVSITVDEIFLATSPAMQEIIRQETDAIRQAVFTDSAAATHELLVESAFVLTKNMERELAEQGAIDVARIDSTTRNKIQRILGVGAKDGSSIQEIARSLRPIFLDRKRARTVARTEIGAANQFGTMAGFESSGVVRGKVWNDSMDAFVRHSHNIGGQQRNMDEPFDLRSGNRAMAPLDRSLPASDVANCRCFVTPILIDDPDFRE